jgi:hypothetical protein
VFKNKKEVDKNFLPAYSGQTNNPNFYFILIKESCFLKFSTSQKQSLAERFDRLRFPEIWSVFL